MRSLVTKLRDRVASLQLKVEQLQIDKEALKYVPVLEFVNKSSLTMLL